MAKTINMTKQEIDVTRNAIEKLRQEKAEQGKNTFLMNTFLRL